MRCPFDTPVRQTERLKFIVREREKKKQQRKRERERERERERDRDRETERDREREREVQLEFDKVVTLKADQNREKSLRKW